MSSRSARDTKVAIMVQHSTPGAVGPGTYAPGRKLSTGRQPNFAAFASSNARKLNYNTNTSAVTPGPGSYVRAPKVSRKDVTSNVFKTTIARLAPSAPGSTTFCPSSIADNPGPGQYRNPFKEPASGPRRPPNCKGESAASRVAKATGTESAALRFNPPTIPRKEQSNGYDTSDRGPMPLPMPGDVHPSCRKNANKGYLNLENLYRFLVDLGQIRWVLHFITYQRLCDQTEQRFASLIPSGKYKFKVKL